MNTPRHVPETDSMEESLFLFVLSFFLGEPDLELDEPSSESRERCDADPRLAVVVELASRCWRLVKVDVDDEVEDDDDAVAEAPSVLATR